MIATFSIAAGASALMGFILAWVSSFAIKNGVLVVICQTIAKICAAVCIISVGFLLPMLSWEYLDRLTDDRTLRVMIHIIALTNCFAFTLSGFMTLTKQTKEFVEDFKWAFHYRKNKA